MGIPRPTDPHGLTDPPAWVETNENELRALVRAFKTASATVSAQLDKARSERLEIFEGATIWSGAAAAAANGSFGMRIRDLESRKVGLDDCVMFFTTAYAAVVNAKSQIHEIVKKTNSYINDVASSDSSDDEKQRLIDSAISSARDGNISVIDEQAESVKSFSDKFRNSKFNPPDADADLTRKTEPLSWAIAPADGKRGSDPGAGELPAAGSPLVEPPAGEAMANENASSDPLAGEVAAPLSPSDEYQAGNAPADTKVANNPPAGELPSPLHVPAAPPRLG